MTDGPTNGGTIRARIAGGALLVLLVALALAGLGIDAAVRSALRSELDELLTSEAMSLASGAQWEHGAFEFDFDRNTLRQFREPRGGAYYELIAGGGVVERSASLAGASLLPVPEPTGQEDPHIAFATTAGPYEPTVRVASISVLRSDGRPMRGAAGSSPTNERYRLGVRVARTTATEDGELAIVRRSLYLALPLAALFGAAGVFFVARRATTPIVRLTASARALAASGTGRLDAGATAGELRALAETLNDACEKVRASADRERRFASDAAHELRTPLSVLRTSLELALSRPRSESEYRDALADALDAALRLNDLSDGLLVLHRAERGAIVREALDLRDVVREAAAQAAAAGDAPARLDLDLDPAPVVVAGHRALLVRLVGNLLQNVFRHGGSAARLTLRNDVDRATLTVDDDGPGFPVAFLPQIFDPLARGESSRSRPGGGAGLGLSIVRAVASAHGGDATAGNRPEGGARVVVRLPRSVDS